MVCGIAGLVHRTRPFDGDGNAIVRSMVEQLHHRGPDALDVWCEGACALGQTRLAIRDLSPTGAQPMVSTSGRFVITYNGETYSQVELREDLARKGVRLRGTSDTEVMLESIAAFGLAWTVKRLIGMFAFGLWDRETKVLALVRDRLGVKPLYWADVNGALAFASELKAFSAIPGWAPTLDRDAIGSYLQFGYVMAPRTAFREVHALEPATIVTVAGDGTMTAEQYWDIREVAMAGIATRDSFDSEDLTDEVEKALADSVRRRMISDVPIGSLLSGGIDSSLVTALMAQESSLPVKTFTVGFPVARYDEAPEARAVAQHLGTDHMELYFEPSHALDLVGRLPLVYDEPFGDSSQLPTMIVSQLTRNHVKVALTGDGGDELFGGYNRYTLGLGLTSSLMHLPLPVRQALLKIALAIPDEWLDLAMRIAPSQYRRPQPANKIRGLLRSVTSSDANAFYHGLVLQWPADLAFVLGARPLSTPLTDLHLVERFPDRLDRMQILDFLTYLPGDILTKVDRASMAVGLETREPLLDHRLVELAWRLPQDMKIRDGRGKWILREILARHVPTQLTDRPKMGFGVPIDEWLRGPLHDWAADLLSEERLVRQALLRPEPILDKWRAHQAGENWAHPLWTVLMLQAWIEEWHPALG